MSYHIVPSNINKIDGTLYGIKPGDVIVISDKNQHTQPLHFSNIKGEPNKPIIITSAGKVTLDIGIGFAYVMKFSKSSNFILSSEMKITGGNKDSMGISCEDRTTDFEIEGVEIFNNGFAGIMFKDNSAFVGDFVLRNVKIHHCFIHDTRNGEGIYGGNSATIDKPTGKLNHTLEDVQIYSNTFKNTALEAIQLGRCVKGAMVYDNHIETYGVKRVQFQNNGIQIGEGTGGEWFNNKILGGTGNGIIVLGSGTTVRDNVILNAGEHGIFCDNRPDTTVGFKFHNNIIVGSGAHCISLQADGGLLNEVINNDFVTPRGNFFEKGGSVLVKEINNFTSRDEKYAQYLTNKYTT